MGDQKTEIREAPPAVVTSLSYPELTVTVETMGGHVVGHPPRDLLDPDRDRKVCDIKKCSWACK